MRKSPVYIFLLLLLGLVPHRVIAADTGWSATVYTDQLNLKNIWATYPFNWQRAYLVGLGVKDRFLTIHGLPVVGSFFDGTRLEVETLFAEHFGLTHQQEAVIVGIIRSRDFYPVEAFSFNLAWGGGFSYDFEYPQFEQSLTGKRTRFNDYMRIETEFTLTSTPWLHGVMLLHHRSSSLGTFGPVGTGSNYFGVGLRADLQGLSH